MSLADTMLNTIYVPMAKREGQWQEDGSGENPYLESPKRGMLLRTSNLAVAGFPSSLQPYDFACFPADFDHVDTKSGNDLSRHVDDLKSQITMVMQGRCERNGVSDPSSRTSLDLRFKDDRCVVDRLGKDMLTARAGRDAARGGGGVPLELRKEGVECTNETRASPPSTKPLKFGIEAILAIGNNKEPEKKTINLLDYRPRIIGRWNGELAAVPPEASGELYGHATGRSGGSKHTAAAYPSPRSTWSNTSPRPLGHHAGGRWECLPGVVEAGRVGWVARDHCPEYHENFPSRHSPYPWARTSDPTIQHCYPLQPTLPPSHPTLPRSFHQAASVSSIRATLVQDNGQDVKCNIGVSGGMVGSLSGNHKRKRSWSRAVFTSLQRKGLEKRFEIQKYVNKPERRQLAAALGLSDAQVKVWFQNRRMKWRHTQQFNRPPEMPEGHTEDVQTQKLSTDNHMNTESDDSNNNDIGKDDQMRPRRAEFGDGTTFVDCTSSGDDIQ